MRKVCTDHMVKISRDVDGPFSKIVSQATEIGIVVPSILTSKLLEAGYSINYQEGDKHGCWVLISKDKATSYDVDNPNIVARAFSHDKADALLQAIYSEMKEEERAKNESKTVDSGKVGTSGVVSTTPPPKPSPRKN